MNINFGELWQVIGRSLLSLVTLFLITKMIGKKQVSQLSLFDYVVGISIGNFAAEMTINLESHYLNGTLAVVMFGLVAYLVSIGTMKSIMLRRFFMGTPTVLIQNGKLVEKGLKKVKFDVNDLLEECRGNGYFDINEIEFALMEANGTVSILPKGEYKIPTFKDTKLKIEKQGLCANVIIDGKIMPKNLSNINHDEAWLRQHLNGQGYKSISDILLATIDVNDKLVVYKKNQEIEICNVLE